MEGHDSWIVEVVERALEEDAATNDVTTKAIVREKQHGRAVITVRAGGVISGQECARAVFGILDDSVVYSVMKTDGEAVRQGEAVAGVEGRLRAILSGERTALNLLQHLSGVATMTARIVERTKGSGITILDTRKTIPGMRALEKRAVLHGGGENHRFDLGSLILVKDNHIRAAGGLGEVIERLGARLAEAEIEVASLEDLTVLRDNPPRRIMLDNFDPEKVREAVGEMSRWNKIPEVEVSGGVTVDTVGRYLIDGIDFISIGSITSSAPALDMSLELVEVY